MGKIVAVIGAGIQGNACAQILDRELDIERIYLLDICPYKLQKAINNSLNKKIKTKIVDANNVEQLTEAMTNADICVDMLLPEYTEKVMQAALNADIDYINTAFDEPFWDSMIKGAALPFESKFIKAKRRALLGCGNSPGMVNVFIRKYCDYLDTVEQINIYGAYNRDYNLLDCWNPGWSVKQAYTDFITDPVTFEHGRYKKYKPFSNIKEFDFECYGKKKMALHSHEECYSVPRIIQKGLQECHFFYEVDPYVAVLYSSGFTSNATVYHQGVQIKATDFLFNILAKQNKKKSTKNIEYSTILHIIGKKNENKVVYNIELPPIYKEHDYIMQRFGTDCIDVALPAIIGISCIEDISYGVHFAEELSVNHFFEKLNHYIPYYSEKVKVDLYK